MQPTYAAFDRVRVFLPTPQHPNRVPVYCTGMVIPRDDAGRVIDSAGQYLIRCELAPDANGAPLVVVATAEDLFPFDPADVSCGTKLDAIAAKFCTQEETTPIDNAQ